jgi:hypothetical protein
MMMMMMMMMMKTVSQKPDRRNYMKVLRNGSPNKNTLDPFRGTYRT